MNNFRVECPGRRPRPSPSNTVTVFKLPPERERERERERESLRERALKGTKSMRERERERAPPEERKPPEEGGAAPGGRELPPADSNLKRNAASERRKPSARSEAPRSPPNCQAGLASKARYKSVIKRLHRAKDNLFVSHRVEDTALPASAHPAPLLLRAPVPCPFAPRAQNCGTACCTCPSVHDCSGQCTRLQSQVCTTAEASVIHSAAGKPQPSTRAQNLACSRTEATSTSVPPCPRCAPACPQARGR